VCRRPGRKNNPLLWVTAAGHQHIVHSRCLAALFMWVEDEDPTRRRFRTLDMWKRLS